MKSLRLISILTSAITTILIVVSVYWLGLISNTSWVYVASIVLPILYLVNYSVFKHFFYNDIYEVIKLLIKINKSSLIDEYAMKKKRLRLLILKDLHERLYDFMRTKQQEVDEMKRIAAFRKEFIADVSHELKTPIFAAQGLVHTLLDGADQDPKVRTRFLQKAAKSLDGLDVLVHDLLTLSHIEIGETKMQFEYFDIKALADEVIDQFQGQNNRLSLVVELNLDKPLIVYADWLRIKQVLNNLISNSIKYSVENEEIQIILKDTGEFITIAVKDNGEGIPTADIDRIFERFYRVDKSRSREKGGTGLGLAIVKHIIEGHHTRIEVESEPGKGSTFRFSLPKGKVK